jgi:hypothetical protein
MLRSLLLLALVKLGHDETIAEGIRRFHIFLEDRKSPLLPPDNRKVMTFPLDYSRFTSLLSNLQCSLGSIPCCDAEREYLKQGRL